MTSAEGQHHSHTAGFELALVRVVAATATRAVQDEHCWLKAAAAQATPAVPQLAGSTDTGVSPAGLVALEERPGLGRVLVARRHIAAGEALFSERPLLTVPVLPTQIE